MKIKKNVISKILNSLSKEGFPKFKVKGIEYESGKIEGKVIWMKKSEVNVGSSEYVLKKDFLVHIEEFNGHRREFNEHCKAFNEHCKAFNEHRKAFNEHCKAFNEHCKEFNDFRKEVNVRIANLEIKMNNGFNDIENKLTQLINSKFDELKQLILNK